jgi:signal transduction histidine kinase
LPKSDGTAHHGAVWYWLKGLPLRAKVFVTVAGAGVAVLGASTHFSFRYWEREAVAAATEQALLATSAVRAGLQPALLHQRLPEARRYLEGLAGVSPVRRARVYAQDGRIVLSADPVEEGRRAVGVWLPDPATMPAGGVLRNTADGLIRVYLPLALPEAGILEVEMSTGPLKAAMGRGARLGTLLLVGSLLSLGVILITMLDREVVKPLQRVDLMLAAAGGSPGGSPGEVARIQASVTRLLEEERRAAKERREVAEQAGLAEVGELAAEMAHEFKRPLASVRTALQLIQQEYVVEDEGQRLLAAVEGQLEQLNGTMRDLLSLARPVEPSATPVELSELLDGALLQIAAYPGRERVLVELDDDPAAGRVRGDRRRLEQALLNLMVNAIEAMPEGGTLSVRTRSAGPGWVELEVADTGAGMTEAERERVLRPFYSTKPQGTGLGLPLVARIVAAHEGRLTLESEPGVGTVARIHLPAVELVGAEVGA